VSDVWLASFTMSSFVVSGGVGFCNALRRTLAGDLSMLAPFQLTVRVNSSCHTDELIAHRIGLVPFKRVGHGDTMEIRVTGPCTVRAEDVVGPAFEPVHPSIEIAHLDVGQQLDLTIHFDEQLGSKHARYAPCAAVGMRSLSGRQSADASESALRDIGVGVDDDRCRITFEVIDGRMPEQLMSLALDRLEERIDRALVALGRQPAHPPKSMC